MFVKRTAERLVLELKDKVGAASIAVTPNSQLLNDLESALRNLGYKSKDIDTLMVRLTPNIETMTFEELLREALEKLRPS